MSEEAGERLARLANERRSLEEAYARQRQGQEATDQARAEANLSFFLGMLKRMVSAFNRTAGPGLAVELKTDATRLELLQSYSLLAALVFEPAAVRVESPPRSGRVLSRRYLLHTTASNRMHVVEENRPEARPGEAEDFLEGVFMLALGLYP